ncbi:MAG TPA: ATPase [Candidatus Fimivicinus intestinavium]|nr:ATPase [Candidatus Fimivicinus intestinavium]
MAIANMKFVKVIGLLSELDTFLGSCCVDGTFQPEQAMQYMSDSMGYSQLVEENPYAPMLQKIEELASSSGIHLREVEQIPKPVTNEETEAFLRQLGERMSELYDERKVLSDQLTTCQNANAQFQHFTGLDINLDDLFSCEFIKVRFGHMPKESTEKLIAYADNPYMVFLRCSSDAKEDWGVYFAPREQIEEVDRNFASLYFERLRIPGAVGTPEHIIAEIQKNMDMLKDQIAALDAKIASYWNEEADHCNLIYTHLKWFSGLFNLRRYAARHGDSFFYVGWIPEDAVKSFEKHAKKLRKITYEINDTDEVGKTVPPVKLKNPRIFRPFEYLVGMFGLPSGKDIDVTAFVAITYTVMFGIMFGDFGQGIVLGLAGLAMWKLKGMQIGKILIPCGASACVFGLVYGECFGYEDWFDPLYHAVGLSGKPVDIMDSITGLLLVSIGIGVVLLTVTMLINIYGCLRHKRFGEALFSQSGLTGIVLYLSGVCFVYNFMTEKTIVPNGVLGALIGVSCVILFFKEILIGLIDHHPDWKPESITDYILENFFELFEYILSFFSNTISFLRIGAFVLVHAGMMTAVFAIAGLTSSTVVNLIVVVLGNLFVMCLEALFTSIQVMRLEFYELFSRCYAGEGRSFEPVRLHHVTESVQ